MAKLRKVFVSNEVSNEAAIGMNKCLNDSGIIRAAVDELNRAKSELESAQHELSRTKAEFDRAKDALEWGFPFVEHHALSRAMNALEVAEENLAAAERGVAFNNKLRDDARRKFIEQHPEIGAYWEDVPDIDEVPSCFTFIDPPEWSERGEHCPYILTNVTEERLRESNAHAVKVASKHSLYV